MHVTIKNLTIHSHGAPSLASMLGNALASAALNARQASPKAAVDEPRYRPVIGQEWPGQGGIYIGARLIAEAPEMLQALRSIAAITTCADQDQDAMCAEIQGICRVALAKFTGGAA